MDRVYRKEVFLVRLTVPDEYPQEVVESQLRTCISFGRPEIEPVGTVWPGQESDSKPSGLPEGRTERETDVQPL